MPKHFRHAFFMQAKKRTNLTAPFEEATNFTIDHSMKGKETSITVKGTDTALSIRFSELLNLLSNTRLMWTQSWLTDRNIWKTLTERKQANDFCSMHKG